VFIPGIFKENFTSTQKKYFPQKILPYLTFGVNSLLNRLLSAEAIFDVGPVRIPQKIGDATSTCLLTVNCRHENMSLNHKLFA